MEFRNAGRVPSRSRRIARVGSALGIAALLGGIGLLAACADSPSAPARIAAPAPRTSAALATPTTVDILLRDVPLQGDLTYTFTVKRGGGTFDFKEAGLKIKVPSNAFLADEMTITVRALAGDVVAYDFGPDGSSFLVPLTLTQITKGTNYYKLPRGTQLQGAYFKDAATDVSDETNKGVTTELIPAVFDSKLTELSFPVTHFSGYMVSWGLSDSF